MLETKTKEGHISNNYQMYTLQTAVTIFHEIGHVFISYLGKGIIDTPEYPIGEAGFRLEKHVFGDRLNFLRDIRVGNRDHGVCPSTIASVQGQLLRVSNV